VAARPAERVLATYAAVDQAAHQLRQQGDPRGLDALRADLLTDLVLAGASQDVSGGRAPAADPVLVRITGTAGALLGRDETPADLDGYGPVPARMLRDLAFTAGAVWRPLLADPTKIDVPSPDRYTPTPRLAEAVRVADGTCRWPGCRQPAWRADLDHVIPHDAGGPTTATNLASLCRRHHRIKTHTKWGVRLDAHRRLHVTSPLGQTATTSPKHLPPDHPPP
jgi:HNH endonuclease